MHEPELKPLFSLIVPAFNAQATLEETLSGIASQSYTDYETIIVDDGSVDGTSAIAESWIAGCDNARVIHQENGGSARAINTGIHAARGEYVVVNSADDILLEDCLKLQKLAIDENSDCKLFCSQVIHFHHSEGWEQPAYSGPMWEYSHKLKLEELLARRFFGSGITFSREVAIDLGGYTPGCYAEDFDFYLRAMLRGYDMWYTKEALARQRVSDFQKSARGMNIYHSVVDIIQNALDLDYISSADKLKLHVALWDFQGLEGHRNIEQEKALLEQKESLESLLGRISNRYLRACINILIQVVKPIARPFRRLMTRNKKAR